MNTDTTAPTLVLIHGLLSSPREFALIAQTLRARDVRFEFLEVPGYTSGARKRPTSWRSWVSAAGEALDRRYPPGSPVVLGGLCVGGAIAAALAAETRPQDVRGVALLSPAFVYDGWSLTRWRHLRRIAYWLGIDRFISIAEREPFGIKNPKIRRWVVRSFEQGDMSSIGPSRMPLWGLRETERLFRVVRESLKTLYAPLLVLHARDDEIATLGSVERALADADVRTKLIVLERSYHMITVDTDRHNVAHALADFVGAPHAGRERSGVDARAGADSRPVGTRRPVGVSPLPVTIHPAPRTT